MILKFWKSSRESLNRWTYVVDRLAGKQLKYTYIKMPKSSVTLAHTQNELILECQLHDILSRWQTTISIPLPLDFLYLTAISISGTNTKSFRHTHTHEHECQTEKKTAWTTNICICSIFFFLFSKRNDAIPWNISEHKSLYMKYADIFDAF